MRVLSWTFSDTFEAVYAELQDKSPWRIRFHSNALIELAFIDVPPPHKAQKSVDLRVNPGLSQRTAEIAVLHELGHLHLVLTGYPAVWERRRGKMEEGLSRNLTSLIHHPLIRPWTEGHGFDYTPLLETLTAIRKKWKRPRSRFLNRNEQPVAYAINLFAHAGQYLEYYQRERSQVTFPYWLPRAFGGDVDTLVNRVDEANIKDPKCGRQLLDDLVDMYRLGDYVIVFVHYQPTLNQARSHMQRPTLEASGSH